MRSAIASIATVTALVCAFLWLSIETPAPYSDRHRTFTKTDERRLERDFPGGFFPNARLYSWCAPVNSRWGEIVLLRTDGSTLWTKQTCWRIPDRSNE